jgi:hypothetical protein
VATTRDFQKDEFVVEYAGELVFHLADIKERRKKRDFRRVGESKPPCYEFQFHFKGKRYWYVFSTDEINIQNRTKSR